MRIKLYISLITIECLVVIILVVQLFLKHNEILGTTVSVSPIKQEKVNPVYVNNLNFYYEPSKDYSDVLPEWLQERPSISINDDYMNDRYNYSWSKDSKTYRIITLGDSFTYGIFVSTKDNWVELLEDLLNTKLHCKSFEKYEVLNLGGPGYDLEYSLERFKMRAVKYNPDLVIWLIKDDDLQVINEYFIPKEREISKEMGIDRSMENYYNKAGQTYPTWRKTYEILERELGSDWILDYQRSILDKFDLVYKSKLLVLSFPNIQNRFKTLLDNYVSQREDTVFFGGLPAIKKDDAHYPDSHPNKKGHELIAEDLFNYLTKNNIIPCN